jgi:hypothetical protein
MKKLTTTLKFTGLFFIFFTFISCNKYVKKEDIKIHNINVTITPNDWVWNADYKTWEYTTSHSFIDQGVLFGYLVTPQGNQALPYYTYDDNVTVGLVDKTSDNKIIVTYADGTTTLLKPATNLEVILKIIPSSMVKPNINMKNYEAVQAAYNL